MPTISLVTSYITLTESLPFVSHSGHLQFVFSNGGTLVETEVQSFAAGFGDWQYPAFSRTHGGDNTDWISVDGIIEDTDRYASTVIDFGPDRTAEDVWELIGQIHASFQVHGVDINYDTNQNSNSYVTTVLGVLGVPLTPALLAAATPADVQQFPGAYVDVLKDGAKTFATGLFKESITLEVDGTQGNDVIRGGIGEDTLGGAAGSDTLLGGGGDDRLDGGDDSDILLAGHGADMVFGGAGNDLLHSGIQSSEGIVGSELQVDSLFGGEDNDILIVSAMNVTADGGGGHDTIYFTDEIEGISLQNSGSNGIEKFVGTSFADTFQHSTDISYFAGGTGDDTFISNGTGTMVVFAGEGADQVHFEKGANILTITVDGLTEGNFHALDLSDPDIYNGIDFTAFDVVVVNPDADDEFHYIDPNSGDLIRAEELGLSETSVTYELEETAPGELRCP